jgi:hypothetical protein
VSLSFAVPLFLWALLGVPLVILLHFIRSRKRRRDVSALFLWARAQELAQRRRRFSSTWLLLLQIVAIALASLGLAQPILTFAGAPDRVLVIDASASMAARDSDGVRLAKALREAETLLVGGGRVAVVRAGLDATVLQAATADGARVRRALESIIAVDRDSNLDRALDLATSIVGEGEVHLFSDRPPPAGFALNYHPVAGDGANLGISTFDVGLQQAYVALVSTHSRPQEVEIEVLQGERMVARTTLLLPAGGQANAIFPLDEGQGVYRAQLVAPAWDALALDDVAYAGSQLLTVVLDRRSPSLERALSAIPGVRWRATAAAATVPADVRILTGSDGSGLERGRYLLFPAPVADARFVTVRDWDRSDPLLRFVDLRETVVGVAADLDTDQGWRVLAQAGDLTPLLTRFESPTLTVVRAAFHPSQSDMVLRPAFPTLIANVLRTFQGDERLQLGDALPPGATLDGDEVGRALAPGIYRVEGREIGASLLNAAESRLPSPTVAASEDGGAEAVDRQRGLGLWLLLVALLALLAEWLLWSGWRPGNASSWRPILPFLGRSR